MNIRVRQQWSAHVPWCAPTEFRIDVLTDGTVIAVYDGEPLFRFDTMGQLLVHHGLTEADLTLAAASAAE